MGRVGILEDVCIFRSLVSRVGLFVFFIVVFLIFKIVFSRCLVNVTKMS